MEDFASPGQSFEDCVKSKERRHDFDHHFHFLPDRPS